MFRHEKQTRIAARSAAAALAFTSWLLVAQPAKSEATPPVNGKRSAVGDVVVGQPDSKEWTLDDAIKLARERREVLNDVKDYTAIFTKNELVGDKTIDQSMEIKCRHEPFSVYLKFRSGKEEGREVIYVTGANEGKLLVREKGLLAGLAGTQNLKLDDSQVMAENRYPITDIGIARIVDKCLTIWQAEKKAGADNVSVRSFPNASVGGVPCEMLEITRKEEGPEFDFSLSRVYFAKDSKLPIRAEQFGWGKKNAGKAPLVELYNYADLKVNVGLGDDSFDPKNPKYAFGGGK